MTTTGPTAANRNHHRGGKHTSAKERYALTDAGAAKYELQGQQEKASALNVEAGKALYAYQELTRMIKACSGHYSGSDPTPEHQGQPFIGITDFRLLIETFIAVPAIHTGNSFKYDPTKFTYRWGLHPYLGQSTAGPGGGFAYVITFFKNDLVAAAASAHAYYLRHNKAADEAQKVLDKLRKNKDTGTGADIKGTWTTKGDLDAQPVVYNVGAVTTAYFRQNNAIQGTSGLIPTFSTSGFEFVSGPDGGLGLNSPSNVENALELWRTTMTNKGMLQTYFPPEGWNTNGNATTAFPADVSIKKYGFQFMFNPNAIGMTYQSTTQVDPAYEMAGKDKFNYLPAVGAGGTISFNLMINRMFDMPFYDKSGHIAEEYKGKSLYPVREPYGPEGVTDYDLFDEQKMIYEAGTMYDIEYLLRTLMGFTMSTELRHQIIGKTADMGIYNLRPVELHLGPAMRYRGRVVTLSINHTLFNERMVPLLSTVSIGFQRYPDYPFTKNSTGSVTHGARETSKNWFGR